MSSKRASSSKWLYTIPIIFLCSGFAGYLNGRTSDWLIRAAITGLSVLSLSILVQGISNRFSKYMDWAKVVSLSNAQCMFAFLGFSAGVIWFH